MDEAARAQVTISAVIPAYNRADTVGRAIESVLGQSVAPDEILVVDDGSTDDTADVISRYPVTSIRQENGGASSARNHGAERARHTWLAFLDSDDYWDPDHLARLWRAVVATEGRARFYFDELVRDVDGRPVSQWERAGFDPDRPIHLVDDATAWMTLPRLPVMLQTSLIDRRAYLDVGGLWDRLRTRHDTHLFLLLGLGGPACAVAGVGAHMTDDADPASRLFATGSAHGPGSRRFAEEGYLLYRDVLRRRPDLDAATERLVRDRARSGAVNLAKGAVAERRPVAALRHAASAVGVAPRLVAEDVARKIARRPRRSRPSTDVHPYTST